MKKRAVKYIAATVVAVVLLYHSVEFKKLDEVQAAGASTFDASGFTSELWEKKLQPGLGDAVPLPQLFQEMNTDADQAFQTHGKTLGIGNIYAFMVKAKGTIRKISADDIQIEINAGDTPYQVTVATEYVYGNAVRDASGLIQIADFEHIMDLNRISENLNERIRSEVVTPLRKQATVDQQVELIGAIELNKRYLALDQVELIPVQWMLAKN